MNKNVKRLALIGLAAMSIGLVAGCGNSDSIGTIDMNKVVTQSNKAKELNQKMQAKQAEITKQLEAAQKSQSEQEFQQTQAKAQQELQVFGQAMGNEFKQTVEANVAEISKEKKLTAVVNEGAVISGGTDITDEVIQKMNGTSGDASAQQSGDANAQKSGDAPKTEEKK